MNNQSNEVSSDSQSTSASRVTEPSTTCSSSDAANEVYADMPDLVPVDPPQSVDRGQRDQESSARSAHAASWAPRR